MLRFEGDPEVVILRLVAFGLVALLLALGFVGLVLLA